MTARLRGVEDTQPRRVLRSIESEFRRYRHLGASAIDQLDDAQLTHAAFGSPLSVATIAWHVAGNLRSRFTDFLSSDGEKPWRDRESEFAPRSVSGVDLLLHWDASWDVLFVGLAELTDGDLSRDVSIRGVPLSVAEALHRSLAHVSYHVGQIVLLARSLRGDTWAFLSIPPGGTSAYNANPTLEKPPQASA